MALICQRSGDLGCTNGLKGYCECIVGEDVHGLCRRNSVVSRREVRQRGKAVDCGGLSCGRLTPWSQSSPVIGRMSGRMHRTKRPAKYNESAS